MSSANKIEFSVPVIKDICQKYGAGYGLQDIAVAYNVSAGVIRRVLAANEVAIRGRGRPTREQIAGLK